MKQHIRGLEGSRGESYTAGSTQRERRLSETGLLRVRRPPLRLTGHRDAISLSLGLPLCSQDQQQSGQNAPGLPITRIPPGSLLQLDVNPKSQTRSINLFPVNAKVVLSESGIPAPSPPAEMAYMCNTHAASHHYFCSLQILLPLTETERIQESCRDQCTDSAFGWAEWPFQKK